MGAQEFHFKDVAFYGDGDRIWAQAQQIWQILVGLVTTNQIEGTPEKSKITYGRLAGVMGKPTQAGRTLTRQLWMIGEYCRYNDLPTLNTIVVNKETGLPGHDVVLNSGNSIATELSNVADYNWASVRQPTISTFRDVWEQISA
ncbi:hypothetical protein [Sphingomicrobium aestuariivivum]|uniref:hypothetical protein n=1 Tax=Sphingomicrobium aestuariivivum TaxID=1582356 RepID=UPI001FD659B3|nr:hypothetical protein [Sphingomicrobium aestuariivivum]MCJ8191189.1 hypothetical protein [Sphingomicrobium aestuariivivum]